MRALTISDLLVWTVTILGASIAAWHDEDGVGAGLGIRAEDRLDRPISEYLQLGQTLIALFFRNFGPIHPVVLSVP